MKDDKKKLVVIGALVAVLLGVGAFTFLGGESAPAPVATETSKPTAEPSETKITQVDENGAPVVAEEATPPKNPLYAMELPQRDPFQASMSSADPYQQPARKPLPPVSRPTGRRSSGGRSGGDYTIPPYQPLSGSLPAAGGSVTLTQTGPDPSEFGYSVSGTMTGGKRPVAVFTDSNGNQRMVPVGGSLDGDSRVVAVEKGSVTIEHRGKKQRLSLGGNPK